MLEHGFKPPPISAVVPTVPSHCDQVPLLICLTNMARGGMSGAQGSFTMGYLMHRCSGCSKPTNPLRVGLLA